MRGSRRGRLVGVGVLALAALAALVGVVLKSASDHVPEGARTETVPLTMTATKKGETTGRKTIKPGFKESNKPSAQGFQWIAMFVCN